MSKKFIEIWKRKLIKVKLCNQGHGKILKDTYIWKIKSKYATNSKGKYYYRSK